MDEADDVTPLVSVVMPCFDARPWIDAAIESALGQTWPAIEIVVVDDGSSDGTVERARSYESRGVRVLALSHRGAAAARNAGLAQARGAFIQFLDADDLLDRAKIATQMEVLQGDPDAVATAAWARFEGDPAEAVFRPQPPWRDSSGVELLRGLFEGGWMMHPAAWLCPRGIVDRAGPWDETLTLDDDGEYFARVALAARRIRFCPGARSYYRSHGAGLSARRDPHALDSRYRAAESTLDRLLAADASRETRVAVAAGWRWLAFELYPAAPRLSALADERCRALGGSDRVLPGGRRFQLASRLLGWRLAKRWFA